MSEPLPSKEQHLMYITKSRKRNGATQYFVMPYNQDEKKGIWVKENDPNYKKLIDQYEEEGKDKKKAVRKPSAGPPRRIQKIAGIMVNDDEWVFIVKFTDSEVFEKVSHSDMRSRYTKSLLAYYEQHIHIKEECK